MTEWYRSGVFYHIYPLGLCGAPKRNTGDGAAKGFLVGADWIAHMKKLGCEAVYIGPLFQSSTHGYDTIDYKKVDTRLGDNEGFRNWVRQCHASGIRVVVDGVFNHTGRAHPAFKDLQENRWDSWGKDWYCHVDFGGRSPLGDPFSYESWHGFAELPRLNLKNPAVCDALMDVIRFWIDEFDIDGIRLDCADMLDFDFLRRMRRETQAMKKDFWLMGEVIHGDYGRWVQPDLLHSVTNYELHKGIYSAHNTHNYFEMAHSIRRLFGEYGLCKDAWLYQFVDNHDVDRIATKLNNREDLYPVYAFLMTIRGIPSIYYGSEAGVEGRKGRDNDDDIRPALTVAEVENADPELSDWVGRLARLRGSREELAVGAYEELVLTNEQYVFARTLPGQMTVTALNNSDSQAECRFRIPGGYAALEDIRTGEKLSVQDNEIRVVLPPHGARVFTAE